MPIKISRTDMDILDDSIDIPERNNVNTSDKDRRLAFRVNSSTLAEIAKKADLLDVMVRDGSVSFESRIALDCQTEDPGTPPEDRVYLWPDSDGNLKYRVTVGGITTTKTIVSIP